MALLFGRQRRVANLSGTYPGEWAGASALDLIPQRIGAPVSQVAGVNHDSALRHSAVWAACRLRANLISTMPVDTFRRVTIGGSTVQIEVGKPPIFVTPGGEQVDWSEWCYSTQFDLDRAGNAVGLITERNSAGLPLRIDLQPINVCALRGTKDGKVYWKIGDKKYALDQVWHEKQYTVGGLPIGLSPVAYAAWSIGEYMSIQDFAATWFGGGGVPRGHLRNRLQTLSSATAEAVKARFKSSVTAGDVFVSGSDWEYSPLAAQQTGMEWLDAKKFSIADIARFFDVPGDLIDAGQPTGSITYANVTQRNLQFLIMHLGPAVVRREHALSRLLPAPRYVKLNTSALLRMDDLTRAQLLKMQIDARIRTPDEARALENLPPLTPAQLAEFAALFGDPAQASPAADSVVSAAPAAPPGERSADFYQALLEMH